MRIIGIDPGLRNTGWGIIEADGIRLRWIADGVIKSTDSLEMPARLAELQRGLAEVLAAYVPAEAAAEEIFLNRNPASTLKLSQARGAVMAAIGLAGLALCEYAPNRVKKTIVGAGHAEKAQIDLMVRHLLPGCLAATPDAADALAVAICHAQFGNVRKFEALVAKARA